MIYYKDGYDVPDEWVKREHLKNEFKKLTDTQLIEKAASLNERANFVVPNQGFKIVKIAKNLKAKSQNHLSAKQRIAFINVMAAFLSR